MPAVGSSLASVLGALLLLGCTNAQTPPASEASASADTLRLSVRPIKEVAGAAYTGIQEPRRALVRTESEWRELWRELTAGTLPPPEPLTIDFETRMVIVAAMGRRPTGGYGIAIEEVRATTDSLYVTVVETSPGAGCLTTQALTAPVAAVSVERHPAEPVFREREEDRDCE